jgi:hypothetical protein
VAKGLLGSKHEANHTIQKVDHTIPGHTVCCLDYRLQKHGTWNGRRHGRSWRKDPGKDTVIPPDHQFRRTTIVPLRVDKRGRMGIRPMPLFLIRRRDKREENPVLNRFQKRSPYPTSIQHQGPWISRVSMALLLMYLWYSWMSMASP